VQHTDRVSLDLWVPPLDARVPTVTCEDETLRGGDRWGSRGSRADLQGSDLSAFDPRALPLDGARIRAEQAVVLAQLLGPRVG
jgi:fluoroquinolone resistance protein